LASALALAVTQEAARAQEAPPAPEPTPSTQDKPSVHLGLFAFAGYPASGVVRVRENELPGTYLHFGSDLGIHVLGEIGVWGGYRFDREDDLAASFSAILLYGDARSSGTIQFNGIDVPWGTPLRSRPLWLVFQLRYERVFVRWGDQDRGRFAAEIGFRYDYLNWKFSGLSVPTNPGHELNEDFYKQAIPIPVLGVSVRHPIDEGLEVMAYARGFYTDRWPTGRSEGGAVSWSESYGDFFLGLAWRPYDFVEIWLGARVFLMQINERSHEDGNAVQFIAPGALAQATFTFL
jgi:hypothetical protein